MLDGVMRRLLASLTLVALLVAPFVLAAQRGGGRFFGFGGPTHDNVRYDGRFTFARVRYGGGSSAWNHDYPDADRNLPLILQAITALRINPEGTNILDLEDPEIFKYPILYVWEPGYWRIGDLAAANLRDYMLKGGFVIFDDFEADQWINFEAQFRRALPDAVFQSVPTTHPLFHSFFDLPTVNVPHPSEHVTPAYYGVFEDDDPSKRMMALANHNSDIAEYWEWSGRGFFPVDTTNDAYKLGVNYIIYGLSH